MFMKTIFAATLLFLSLGLAKKTDGQFEITIKNNSIELVSKKGFHFNDKAPAYALFDESKEKIKPSLKTELKFVFSSIAIFKKAALSFYVCDDAKTVCEQQSVQVVNKPSAELKKQNSQVAAVIQPSDDINRQSHYSKTTLLVFSAPWCPACIRLHSETMATKAFKTAVKNIEVKEINIDLVENEKISDQYGVKAIPTMVLVNTSGDEVIRWLDYQEINKLAPELKKATKETVTIQDKIAKARAGDKKLASELGYNAYNKMNWKEAIQWFEISGTKKDLTYKLASEVSLAEEFYDDNEQSKKDYLDVVEKAITLTPSEFDRMRWSVDLFKKSKEQKKEIVSNKLQDLSVQIEKVRTSKQSLKQTIANSTYGDIRPFEKAELIDLQLRLAKLTPKESEKTELVALLKTKLSEELSRINLNKKHPGMYINAIQYHSEAGELEKCEELYKELISQHDKTYVYYQKYANFLVKQKKYDQALKQIDSAIQFAEGNVPQLHLIKIKVLKELGQKEVALKLIDETQKIAQPYPTKYKRTLAQLKDLKEKLEK